MDRIYPHMDANESAFFSRQLEHIKAKVYPTLYPDLKGRQFIPVDSSAGDGVDTITYREEDSFGKAKVITDNGKDLPRADVKGSEVSSPVRDLGIAFGYSLRELRSSARFGTDLPMRKARAARRGAELALDDIAFAGDSVAGLKGFANHASVGAAAVATQGGFTTWAQKLGGSKPEYILDDLNEAVATIRGDTKGIHSPSTILMPEAKYTTIAQTRMGTTDGAHTILSFFLKTNPFIKEILPWYKLSGAGAGGTDRMIVYERSPEVVTLEIPNEFEMMDPQLQGLEYVIPCRLVTGGVLVYRPKAMLYRDGF